MIHHAPKYVVDRIESEFFAGATICLDWQVSGNRIVDNKLTIGGRLALETHASALCHEMAHFVEIDEGRCGSFGWGLSYAEVFIFNRMVSEPRTTAMTERELRVCAYQANLMEYLGLRDAIRTTVKALRIMPDWCLIPCGDKVPYRRRDGVRVRWCMDRINELRTRDEYQVKAFVGEWWRRQDVLRGLQSVQD